jgi:O-antigen/teichoic acid export membrane protein
VSAAGLLAGVIYVGIAIGTLRELGSFLADPRAIVMVVAQAGALPTAMMFDQSAVALRRADGVLERSVVAGFARVGLVVCLCLLSAGTSLPALSIALAWFGSTLLACLMGHAQIRRLVRGFKLRPALHREFVQQGLLIGLPNHFVSLAIVGPGLVLSILVTELLSPSINAFWYIAWMLAGIVFVVPSSNGLALFAELTNHPERTGQANLQSIRSSLLFGIPLAACLGVAAGWALPFLGEGYSAGVTPVRLMVLGVLPMTFVETYVANCRAMHNLREPAITLAIGGIATVGAAALGGVTLGLNGVALAWLTVECAMGAWAGWRLRGVLIHAARHSDSLGYEPQVRVLQTRKYGTED